MSVTAFNFMSGLMMPLLLMSYSSELQGFLHVGIIIFRKFTATISLFII